MITKEGIIAFIGKKLPARFTIDFLNEGERQFEEKNEPWAEKLKKVLLEKSSLFTVRDNTNDCQRGEDISFYISSGGSAYAHVAIFSLETLSNFVEELLVFCKMHNEITDLRTGSESIILTIKHMKRPRPKSEITIWRFILKLIKREQNK